MKMGDCTRAIVAASMVRTIVANELAAEGLADWLAKDAKDAKDADCDDCDDCDYDSN